MKKILFINSCVRPESRTQLLARDVLSRMDGQVTELELQREDIQPLDGERLAMRELALKSGQLDHPLLRLARQFVEADEIVIAAPYWDLMFPALLRIYFEAVTVTGVSFRYSPEGIPIGMCKAKRLIYVTTSGGPIFADFGYEYAKAMAQGFYGIADTVCVKAENLDIIGADVEALLAKARDEISNLI